MATGKDVINALKKHLGEGGSFVWNWYGAGSGWAWCNATVCWSFAHAGASKLYYGGKKVSYCPTSIKWCENNYAQIPLELADAGDVVYFDWDKNGVPNHIGFIRARGTHTVAKTIEGNAGSPSRVRALSRPTKYIQAVFRPPYPMAKKPTTYKVKEDGVFGQSTIFSLQHVLKVHEDGILGKGTVRAIQKLVGASVDGHWGTKTTKKFQRTLGVKQDGDFGEMSVKALQKLINNIVSKETKKEEPTKTTTTKKRTYEGTFPALIPATARKAVECAYAYKTSPKEYKFSGGKPKAEYKKALNKAYPNRSAWGAKSRAGASCDVFVGTVLRASGVDKSFPRGLAEQHPWLKKKYKKVSSKQNGDIVSRTNHIAIVVDLKGVKRYANAHHETNGGTYGIVEAKGSFNNIYRPNTKLTALQKGDKFTSVKDLKKFLNWYGGYGLKENYNFAELTEKAVIDFQKREGLEGDGKFGVESLARAKKVKK